MDAIDSSPYFISAPFMGHSAYNEPDGNSLLYHGTFILILSKLGLIDNIEIKRFQDAVDASWLECGSLKRGFNKNDPESHDDYIGVVAAAKLYYPGAAKEIGEYGIEEGWCWYDKRYPGRVINQMFFRFPSFVPHIKVCAGFKLNLLDQILWSAGVIINSFSAETEVSGKILTWCEVEAMRGQGYWICELAIKIWENSIKKMYTHLMGDVFSMYFNSDHIFALYMKDKM